MKKKNQPAFDKNETKLFYRRTNKLIFSYLKSSLKYLLLFKFKISKRYLDKVKSLIHNKKLNNYPTELIKTNKRVAVYTVLYGNCDEVKKINFVSKHCDFYIFTDQEVPPDSGWKKLDYKFPNEVNTNILKNRFLKMHPHLLFGEYEYAIYLDAVFIIELDIFRLLGRMGEKKLGLFKHHASVNCLYEEADRLIRIGKVSEEETNIMMKRYRDEGFPEDFGFFECSIIVQKMNDIDNIRIMDVWWSEFYHNVKRDQLSFMYSLWKCGFDDKYVSCLGLTFWIEPIVIGIGHKNFK